MDASRPRDSSRFSSGRLPFPGPLRSGPGFTSESEEENEKDGPRDSPRPSLPEIYVRTEYGTIPLFP